MASRKSIHIYIPKYFMAVRNCIKQLIMPIEDRLFDRGGMRSAMASRKSRDIYTPKYFMAVRNCINIFVLC